MERTKTEAVEEPSPVEKEDKKDKNSFLRFLPGAVFDLYADSNANQEYDPDDQKNRENASRSRVVVHL